MTKSNTEINTINASEIGATDEDVKEIKNFLVVERAQTSATFLRYWLQIGDYCTRIKSLKMEGKFSDNVNAFFGTPLSNDERQYSMKLHDNKKDVEKWYRKCGSKKFNPRTIWTAYQADVNPPKEKEKSVKKDGGTPEPKEKELRKERTSTDVLKAYTEFRRIFDNASENGNLELKDFQMLLQGLEATISEVKMMTEFEENATKETPKKAKKSAKTKKAA